MPSTVFELVGGQAGMDSLVNSFYTRVEHDPVLRPLYPADLGDSRRHLALFLAQYFGGPTTYSDERGHPRLRMRHAHVQIGLAERDAWFAAMAAALDDVAVVEPARSAMLEYFSGSADWMINHK
ncbi:MAG TPA: globin [Acidimicrobiia bacterium]